MFSGKGTKANREMKFFSKYFWVCMSFMIAIAIYLLINWPRSHPYSSPEEHAVTKTKSYIHAVDTAIYSYHGEYDKFPYSESQKKVDQNCSIIVAILTPATNSARSLEANPKGITFLEDYFLDRNPDLRDAWGNSIHIWFSTNQDGALRVGGEMVQEGYAIWSDGPNGKNEYGQGDDIRSWK